MNGTEFFVKISKQPPASNLHPRLGEFFKGFLAHEKIRDFQGKYVINTHFPPYPGPSFTRLVERMQEKPSEGRPGLYSVTLAVTNRCPYQCWHCYNAGRKQSDLSLKTLADLAKTLQDLGAIIVTITGGEPLLRPDLEEVISAFDDRTTVVMNTTGFGLTSERALALKKSGLFALGISLDSQDAEEHDKKRSYAGAFRIAHEGIAYAHEAGLYPYFVTVGNDELLQPERFFPFLRLAREIGALEVHLIEPSASGRLQGKTECCLKAVGKNDILELQKKVNSEENLPTLSTFTHLESAEAFGCGAGLTHLYIDGSGEVCPCNLVPMSFGNILHSFLESILDVMNPYFARPRTFCIGKIVSKNPKITSFPTPPETSHAICRECLPESRDEPKFFQIRQETLKDVGQTELQSAYDQVHGDYNEFWVSEAGRPVAELVSLLPLKGSEFIFEVGCGTGYGTENLARRMSSKGKILAVDLSEGMLSEAKKRLSAMDQCSVSFRHGDALKILGETRNIELIFSSWVLGYIPLRPLFKASREALIPEGMLAFVVHKDHSPAEPLEIFHEIVARDPSVLTKRVWFDFPESPGRLENDLEAEGFSIEKLISGNVVFRYPTADAAFEHLIRSGAGTAFYEAINPRFQDELKKEFLRMFNQRRSSGKSFPIVHEYFSVIARSFA